MGKSSGLGDNAYVGGYDLSSDVLSIDTLSTPLNTQDVTPINALGHARLGLLRDGQFSFTTALDVAAGFEHTALSGLPTADVICTYCLGLGAAPVVGNQAFCINAKEVDYPGTRASDGSILLKPTFQANSFGGEWGNTLTPGLRTDASATAASSSNSYDTGQSLSFGAQAYLQVTAFAGTSVTVAVWDSADNSTFLAVASFAFTAVTSAPASQRIALGNTATLRRYLAVATTGTFSNAVFSVVVIKNPVGGVVF